MNRWLEFLKEDNGSNSSMRLIMVLWGAGTFVVWTILSFYHGSLQAIPESVVASVAAMVTGKVIQKFGESKT